MVCLKNPLRLLLIEDDIRLLDLLRTGLWEQGHCVLTASDGETGLSLARAHEFDVIILDIGLPGCDGYHIASSLRAEQNSVAILMLTARDMDEDVIRGLDMGADEYMRKPFSFLELLARIAAVSRRVANSASPEYRFEDLHLRYRERRLFRANCPIHLSPSEFALIETLIRHAGRTVSRDALARTVWGSESAVSTHALDTLVGALRAKLQSPSSRTAIRTVRGTGYVLQHCEPRAEP